MLLYINFTFLVNYLIFVFKKSEKINQNLSFDFFSRSIKITRYLNYQHEMLYLCSSLLKRYCLCCTKRWYKYFTTVTIINNIPNATNKKPNSTKTMAHVRCHLDRHD